MKSHVNNLRHPVSDFRQMLGSNLSGGHAGAIQQGENTALTARKVIHDESGA